MNITYPECRKDIKDESEIFDAHERKWGNGRFRSPETLPGDPEGQLNMNLLEFSTENTAEWKSNKHSPIFGRKPLPACSSELGCFPTQNRSYENEIIRKISSLLGTTRDESFSYRLTQKRNTFQKPRKPREQKISYTAKMNTLLIDI
jgi:hypothetical protein